MLQLEQKTKQNFAPNAANIKGDEISQQELIMNAVATFSTLESTTFDSDTQVLTSPPVLLTEPSDYDASCARYERLSELRLRNSDTIILGGYGCCIKVRNGSLCVEYDQGNKKLLKWHRGTSKIKTLILCAHGGYLTLDAIDWLIQQKITAYIMDWKGEIVQTLSPRQNRNARLCLLQWQALESELGVSIATELIRRKTLAQIETLNKLEKPDAIPMLEDGICTLHTKDTIEKLRQIEASLAAKYFASLADIPINWKSTARRIVPEHWLKVGYRSSPLSSDDDARHAINPYHASLNFANALLKAQVLQAINVAGLESTVGFLHSYQDGKQSLVFDLMEPFRAQVDYLVLQFFQKTVLKKGDFIQWFTGECRMNEELRRYILASCRIKNEDIDKLCKWLRTTLES